MLDRHFKLSTGSPWAKCVPRKVRVRCGASVLDVLSFHAPMLFILQLSGHQLRKVSTKLILGLYPTVVRHKPPRFARGASPKSHLASAGWGQLPTLAPADHKTGTRASFRCFLVFFGGSFLRCRLALPPCLSRERASHAFRGAAIAAYDRLQGRNWQIRQYSGKDLHKMVGCQIHAY